MANHRRTIVWIAWAWAVGWVLVSAGMMISDVYSSPNRGLTAAYMLGLAGWATGAAITIDYVRQQFGIGGHLLIVSATGWGVGAIVAVVAGLSWLQSWSLSYYGPIAATAIGGAIGGAGTLPVQRPTSIAKLVSQSAVGAFSWGATFLIFQVLAFYAGYILTMITVNPLALMVGFTWAKVPGWALPAGICGFLAALLASRSLYFTGNVLDASRKD